MVQGTGGDLSLFNYRQCEDGKWIGHNSSSCFQTVNTFEQGESPERFKYENFKTATTEQKNWYMPIEKNAQIEQNKNYQSMVDQYLEDGGSLSDF